jgi:hypothetical protein
LLVWAKDFCYRLTRHFRRRRHVPLVSSSLLLGHPMFVAPKWHQKEHRCFATGQDKLVVVFPVQYLGDTSAESQDKHNLVRSKSHPRDMFSACEGGIRSFLHLPIAAPLSPIILFIRAGMRAAILFTWLNVADMIPCAQDMITVQCD